MNTTYTIGINGMHCIGCKSLITMSLEDEGMTNVSVDEKRGVASFGAHSSQSEVVEKLDRIFQELKEYNYSLLTTK